MPKIANAIARGGWLAGRRKWVALALAVAPALAAYLTGDLDLPGLLAAVLQALLGMIG